MGALPLRATSPEHSLSLTPDPRACLTGAFCPAPSRPLLTCRGPQTQTRFHLPVWLGIGTALADASSADLLPLLQTMYQQWPFFKVTLDMVEMVLAKADPRIAVLYERELVDPELHEFGAQLRQLFFLTENKLLEVTGHSNLLEGPTGAPGAQLGELRQKLNLRTPYITPLNILQAHYLKKQRALEKGNVPAVEWHPKVPFAQELMQLGGGGHSTLHSAVEDIILITIKGARARSCVTDHLPLFHRPFLACC